MCSCSSATCSEKTAGEEEALNTLAEARGLYPREQSLIIEELNIYLTNEEFDKAKENLDACGRARPDQ